jgi:hypothetical protein
MTFRSLISVADKTVLFSIQYLGSVSLLILFDEVWIEGHLVQV